MAVALDALQPLLEVVEVGGGRGGTAGAVGARVLLEVRLARLLQLGQFAVEHVCGGRQCRLGQGGERRTLVILLLLLLLQEGEDTKTV